MKIFIGIDPGQTGAVGILYEGDTRKPEVYDLSASQGDNAVLLAELADRLLDEGTRRRDIHVCLEHVGAMPKQGVTSSFNFGKSFGVLLGALYVCGLGFTTATPAQWTAKMKDASFTGQARKDKKAASRDLARRLFPDLASSLKRVKDDGRAEALLIAAYCRETILHPPAKPPRWTPPEDGIDVSDI